MENRNNNTEIEKLVQIASDLQNLYYKKVEQLEGLKLEISELSQLLTNLKTIISTRSFHGADELYSQLIKKSDKLSDEQYFSEKIPKDRLDGSVIKRKIYSKDEVLLSVLDFIDMSEITIKFMDPDKASLQETSEDFINIFLKEALVEIKETNPNLEVSYKYKKNSDIIKSIRIIGISTIEQFDLITLKIQELLNGK